MNAIAKRKLPMEKCWYQGTFIAGVASHIFKRIPVTTKPKTIDIIILQEAIPKYNSKPAPMITNNLCVSPTEPGIFPQNICSGVKRAVTASHPPLAAKLSGVAPL